MLALLSRVLLLFSVAMAMLFHHDLIQACKSGDVEATRHLLKSLNPGANDNEAIMEASRWGHSDVVQLLLADPRVDPSANDNSAIRLASYFGHATVVKLMLANRRVDPGAFGNAAIIEASFKGHSEVVRLLLADPRVDPTDCGNNAINNASNYGHPNVVKLLLADPRVDPSARNNEAICCASRKGHANVVKLLLADPRVDPSASNNDAIINASQMGYADVVELLLADPRVDPNANDHKAINGACKQGHTNVIKLLMAHPKVLPNIDIVQKTFENVNLKVEFFQAATDSAGLTELLPLANLVDGLSLDLLDIFISRAKGIPSNQKFLHSLRLLKLPIPAKIKLAYYEHLQALFSVSSSSGVVKFTEIMFYLAEMGIDADLFRLIVQYF